LNLGSLKTMQSIPQTVAQNLLHANQLSAENLAQSLVLIGAHHVDYADIYCQRNAFESWHLDEGIVKSGSYQIDQGVGVRAVSGEKTAFAYADSLTDEAVRRAAQARSLNPGLRTGNESIHNACSGSNIAGFPLPPVL